MVKTTGPAPFSKLIVLRRVIPNALVANEPISTVLPMDAKFRYSALRYRNFRSYCSFRCSSASCSTVPMSVQRPCQTWALTASAATALKYSLLREKGSTLQLSKRVGWGIGRIAIRNVLGGKYDWMSRGSIGTRADGRGLGFRRSRRAGVPPAPVFQGWAHKRASGGRSLDEPVLA